MKHIKVLGSGCSLCKKTVSSIEQIAAKKGVEIQIEKVTDPEKISCYKVMSTPAVVVDEELVHVGGLPRPSAIEFWLI